jgi:hypothetical protein
VYIVLSGLVGSSSRRLFPFVAPQRMDRGATAAPSAVAGPTPLPSPSPGGPTPQSVTPASSASAATQSANSDPPIQPQLGKDGKPLKPKHRKINKKHPEFELTYDMMLGIRTCVGM